MLSPILNAIILKMRYDETSSWGNEDEQTDEAEFQDLRKRLQVLQKTVAAVDEVLYVDILSNLVCNISCYQLLTKWTNLPVFRSGIPFSVLISKAQALIGEISI
jgi:hypothetical protein